MKGEPERRRDFYRLLERGDRRGARLIAEALLKAATDPAERARWEKWTEALRRPGGRIKYGAYPAEVFLDDDLKLLEEIRALPEVKEET